jgi:hypothetical protein
MMLLLDTTSSSHYFVWLLSFVLFCFVFSFSKGRQRTF